MKMYFKFKLEKTFFKNSPATDKIAPVKPPRLSFVNTENLQKYPINEKIESLDTQNLTKLSIDTDGKRQDHIIDNNRNKDDCEFLKPTIILNSLLDAVEHIVKSL